MKLLFDHNLSPKLVPLLKDIFDSAHAFHLGIDHQARDETTYDLARREGYIIVTADRDFLDLAARLGSPPKVIRLQTMKYTTRAAADLLRRSAIAITEFAQSSRAILILENEL